MSNSGFTGKELEFVAGSIQGWRRWRIDKQGRLTGISFRSVWVPGENIAKCHINFSSKHDWDPECTCGFWARRASGTESLPTSKSLDTENFAVGVIDGYGKTVVGDQGFRSEKAKITALVVPSGGIFARRIAKLYPDVTMYNTLDELYDAFLDVIFEDPTSSDFWDTDRYYTAHTDSKGTISMSSGTIVSVTPIVGAAHYASGTNANWHIA